MEEDSCWWQKAKFIFLFPIVNKHKVGLHLRIHWMTAQSLIICKAAHRWKKKTALQRVSSKILCSDSPVRKGLYQATEPKVAVTTTERRRRQSFPGPQRSFVTPKHWEAVLYFQSSTSVETSTIFGSREMMSTWEETLWRWQCPLLDSHQTQTVVGVTSRTPLLQASGASRLCETFKSVRLS